MPYIRTDVKNVLGRKTLAYCPKCQEYHHTWADWQGRGVLRSFCPPCRINVNKRSGGMDDASSFNRQAVVAIGVHTGRS